MNTPETFYDIYDFYYIQWWQTKSFKYTSIILVIVLTVLCTYLLIKHMKKNRKREALPWEWAKDKVVMLAMDDLSKKEEYKQLYVALIEILKKYFLLRFGWNVSTYTDEELIIFVQSKNKDIESFLETIINNARMIKFANEQALQAHAGDALEAALQIIKTTKEHTEKK